MAKIKQHIATRLGTRGANTSSTATSTARQYIGNALAKIKIYCRHVGDADDKSRSLLQNTAAQDYKNIRGTRALQVVWQS